MYKIITVITFLRKNVYLMRKLTCIKIEYYTYLKNISSFLKRCRELGEIKDKAVSISKHT